MIIHAVKCSPEYFLALKSGKKTFEVRRNDRDYRVGDILGVNEYEVRNSEFTGESLLFVITYILSDNVFVKRDYVILALKPLEVLENGKT